MPPTSPRGFGFLNTGPGQIPGLIVMTLADEGEGRADLDPACSRLVVVFNAGPEAVTFGDPSWQGASFALHPALAASADPVSARGRLQPGAGGVPGPRTHHRRLPGAPRRPLRPGAFAADNSTRTNHLAFSKETAEHGPADASDARARCAGKLKHALELAPHELEALQGALGRGRLVARSLRCWIAWDTPRRAAPRSKFWRGSSTRTRCRSTSRRSPRPTRRWFPARPRCWNAAPTTIRFVLLPLFEDARTSKQTLESILMARASSLSCDRLLALFPDQGGETRGVVARLLDATVDAAAVPSLVRALEHPQWWVRLQAARLLARFPESAAALARRVGDEHRSVRLEAIQGLRLVRARSEMPALLAALRDRDLKVQTAAIDAVVALGDASTVPSLLGLLSDESEHVRRAAVEVLNALATPAAVQDLARALRDADWWVRVRAADALGTLGGERVVEAVMGLLAEEDESLRRYAVEILNAVPSERAVPLLIRAVEDTDWWVRERAIDALAKTKDPRAVEPLARARRSGQRDHRALRACAGGLRRSAGARYAARAGRLLRP